MRRPPPPIPRGALYHPTAQQLGPAGTLLHWCYDHLDAQGWVDLRLDAVAAELERPYGTIRTWWRTFQQSAVVAEVVDRGRRGFRVRLHPDWIDWDALARSHATGMSAGAMPERRDPGGGAAGWGSAHLAADHQDLDGGRAQAGQRWDVRGEAASGQRTQEDLSAEFSALRARPGEGGQRISQAQRRTLSGEAARDPGASAAVRCGGAGGQMMRQGGLAPSVEPPAVNPAERRDPDGEPPANGSRAHGGDHDHARDHDSPPPARMRGARGGYQTELGRFLAARGIAAAAEFDRADLDAGRWIAWFEKQERSGVPAGAIVNLMRRGAPNAYAPPSYLAADPRPSEAPEGLRPRDPAAALLAEELPVAQTHEGRGDDGEDGLVEDRSLADISPRPMWIGEAQERFTRLFGGRRPAGRPGVSYAR